MKPSKVQYRGNCPCCGHLQAVLHTGKMAKHGYTVEHGWFQGVCSGQQFAPMQHERVVAEDIIFSIRNDVVKLLKDASDIQNGICFPSTISVRNFKSTSRSDRYIDIPFNEGTPYQQECEIANQVNSKKFRAEEGKRFADYLQKTLDTVHGTKLIEVEIEQDAAPIQVKEQRKTPKDTILTVLYVQGPRIYWINERGFKGWTGVGAWRKFELVK